MSPAQIWLVLEVERKREARMLIEITQAIHVANAPFHAKAGGGAFKKWLKQLTKQANG